MMNRTKALLLSTRPKTLTAAFVPVFSATAYAFAIQGVVHWGISLCALLSSFFIQIGTNLVNDAADFKTGADTSERMGPMRVTQAGLFTYGQVMFFAGLSFLFSVALGIPLVMWGGWPIVIVGLVSVLMGYAYTAGPFPLAYKGLGDLFVVLFFGLVAVCGMFYLQTGGLTLGALVLGLQVGFHATVLIAINNLRDIEGDRQVNKKTLAVRFGKYFVRKEIWFLLMTPFVLLLYWGYQGHFWAFLLPWSVLPLAVKLGNLLQKTEPSPEYNRFLGQAAGIHLLFGVFISVGFFL